MKNKDIYDVIKKNIDEERIPLNYLLMEKSESHTFIIPIESEFHNDDTYRSFEFYKPISKIFIKGK